jgi:hypothetical protein
MLQELWVAASILRIQLSAVTGEVWARDYIYVAQPPSR